MLKVLLDRNPKLYVIREYCWYVLVPLFQLEITIFDLLVNGAAKLTQSRASPDRAMAVAAFRCAGECYSDSCQD